MKIKIIELKELDTLKNYYSFENYTKVIRHIIKNHLNLIIENRALSNENMILKLKLEMLKKNK